MDLNSSYVMEARVLALQVDHVASPITPRDGLIMKPWKIVNLTYLSSSLNLNTIHFKF